MSGIEMVFCISQIKNITVKHIFFTDSKRKSYPPLENKYFFPQPSNASIFLLYQSFCFSILNTRNISFFASVCISTGSYGNLFS